ncbi:MAG: sigma-70 family RNA polymerase sigma factor [Oscillospiraceae bacterium]|nr:sigma-70 family RNA polymerase sigma factor [Oscillospiraceae bacterium]
MNSEALTGYIEMFHKSVYRLAYSYVKNHADAEDITQEAFLRLYRSEVIFPSDKDCRAWLFRVTVNLSKNLLKSCWFTRRTELDESIPCESREDSTLLESVMKLPPKYRVTIHLYYYEGYSVKEIADIMGASVSSVTTRLSRGREQLKEMLQKEGF